LQFYRLKKTFLNKPYPFYRLKKASSAIRAILDSQKTLSSILTTHFTITSAKLSISPFFFFKYYFQILFYYFFSPFTFLSLFL